MAIKIIDKGKADDIQMIEREVGYHIQMLLPLHPSLHSVAITGLPAHAHAHCSLHTPASTLLTSCWPRVTRRWAS